MFTVPDLRKILHSSLVCRCGFAAVTVFELKSLLDVLISVIYVTIKKDWKKGFEPHGI